MWTGPDDVIQAPSYANELWEAKPGSLKQFLKIHSTVLHFRPSTFLRTGSVFTHACEFKSIYRSMILPHIISQLQSHNLNLLRSLQGLTCTAYQGSGDVVMKKKVNYST